jgi:hypothetical protein
VVLLKHVGVRGGGKVTRPVQALMNEVLARQRGRREVGVKEGTGIGKKITASLELVLQGRSANALARGGVGTESAWKKAISQGIKRAMRLELEYLVQLKSSLFIGGYICGISEGDGRGVLSASCEKEN